MIQRDNFTFSELEAWLDDQRVTEIECLVPDLTGVARGKILPRKKFTEERGMRLPEAIVAIGVTGILFFQSFVNIGMNLGIMPVTGITLPFVSQGSSSLWTFLMAQGILQSVLMRHRKHGFQPG